MSENMEKYGEVSEDRTKLLFIAKRLADIAKDIDDLNDDDKKYVVERADMLNPLELVELYNALLEYME